MKRIRIGKDIEIHWPILTNGQQVALEGRDLRLFVHLPSHMDIPVDFTTVFGQIHYPDPERSSFI